MQFRLMPGVGETVLLFFLFRHESIHNKIVGLRSADAICGVFCIYRVEGPDAKKTACYDIDVEVVSVV